MSKKKEEDIDENFIIASMNMTGPTGQIKSHLWQSLPLKEIQRRTKNRKMKKKLNQSPNRLFQKQIKNRSEKKVKMTTNHCLSNLPILRAGRKKQFT